MVAAIVAGVGVAGHVVAEDRSTVGSGTLMDGTITPNQITRFFDQLVLAVNH